MGDDFSTSAVQEVEARERSVDRQIIDILAKILILS